jgi:hypothetical protein
MKMMKGISFIGTMFLLVFLVNCSVNVDEKLKDPNFINWISDKSENELMELKKDGNFHYKHSNIQKWEAFYGEWSKIVEAFVPDEIYKDRNFRLWLFSNKSQNEFAELQKDGKFIHDYFNNKNWEKFYEEWDKISEPFLIEEIIYNDYGVQDNAILKDSKEIFIAEKEFFHSPYNYTQVTQIVYRNTVHGLKNTLFIIDYEGKLEKKANVSQTKMLLCLNNKGIIVEENGMPKFIKAFNAKQKTTSKNEYIGSFIKKTTSKIYPCEDCDSINKKIIFVW